jgi:glycosyltransferase involved in cell wall biosynthesis
MFRWGLRRADLVIAQNQDQADLVRDNWRRPVELIPNFHAEDHGLPGRFDGPVIFVGALRPVKRPDLFIELARAMPLRRFRLIGGPAPGSEAYARQIQASAADVPNLEFTGFVPFVDVGREFDGAALLVNTSDFEGFPNTFLQAWLRGLPSLSFVRPTDEQGQTGTIAATDLTDMIHRARHLLAAESVWREAADQALRFYQTHHTREAVIGRFANAFERLLAGPRP